MFMYKLNLQNLDESNWIGSKVCLKKFFQNQNGRDLKFKKYPFWRIDKLNNQIIKSQMAFFFFISKRYFKNKIQGNLITESILFRKDNKKL